MIRQAINLLLTPLWDLLSDYRYRNYDKLFCQVRREGDQIRVLIQSGYEETTICIDPNGTRDTIYFKSQELKDLINDYEYFRDIRKHSID